MTDPETRAIPVDVVDLSEAEAWRFIECRHCSEYEGDFVADLAADFARHRITALETLAAENARLREMAEAAIYALRENGYPKAADILTAALSPVTQVKGSGRG